MVLVQKDNAMRNILMFAATDHYINISLTKYYYYYIHYYSDRQQFENSSVGYLPLPIFEKAASVID